MRLRTANKKHKHRIKREARKNVWPSKLSRNEHRARQDNYWDGMAIALMRMSPEEKQRINEHDE